MNSFAVVLAGAVLLNIYALALVLIRGPLYQRRIYRPMVWNTWLSVLPALVLAGALVLLLIAAAVGSRLLVFAAIHLGGTIWLLMLPTPPTSSPS